MGKCNIDHAQADVVEKFTAQQEFLPTNLVGKVEDYLQEEQSQADLNELFHLLKKYDLATEEERVKRDEALEKLIG